MEEKNTQIDKLQASLQELKHKTESGTELTKSKDEVHQVDSQLK